MEEGKILKDGSLCIKRGPSFRTVTCPEIPAERKEGNYIYCNCGHWCSHFKEGKLLCFKTIKTCKVKHWFLNFEDERY